MIETWIAPRCRQDIAAAIAVEKVVRPDAKPGMIERHLHAAAPQIETQASRAFRPKIQQTAKPLCAEKRHQAHRHRHCHRRQPPTPPRRQPQFAPALQPAPCRAKPQQHRRQPQKQRALAEGQQQRRQLGNCEQEHDARSPRRVQPGRHNRHRPALRSGADRPAFAPSPRAEDGQPQPDRGGPFQIERQVVRRTVKPAHAIDALRLDNVLLGNVLPQSGDGDNRPASQPGQREHGAGRAAVSRAA